ncbi:MAG: EamA family transporter [Lachnospiraceae bacterium]|nr:EamA family transporter [Lachnospiraceae bacterium]
MNRGVATLIYVCSGGLAALSQLILKSAAKRSENRGGKRIFNLKVIIAYCILFMTIFMSMFAMRFISYKYVPVLTTISYVFVFLLSYFVLKEHITKKQIMGVFLILLGIVIYNMS